MIEISKLVIGKAKAWWELRKLKNKSAGVKIMPEASAQTIQNMHSNTASNLTMMDLSVSDLMVANNNNLNAF